MRVRIQDVADELGKELTPGRPTVDKLEFGDPEAAVTGIVAAFAATERVLERALELKANLVVSHEGVFYSHHGDPAMLEGDPVSAAKRERIERSGLAIYRYHDGPHRRRPDGIAEALAQALDWNGRVEEHLPEATVLELGGAMTALEVAARLKEKLGVKYVRAAGNLSHPCRRIGLFVGYRGGAGTVLPLIRGRRLDLVIAGEGPEWELPEYVRDADCQGRGLALLMLGHAESETPGMKRLADELAAKFPGVPVFHVEDEPAYRIL